MVSVMDLFLTTEWFELKCNYCYFINSFSGMILRMYIYKSHNVFLLRQEKIIFLMISNVTKAVKRNNNNTNICFDIS